MTAGKTVPDMIAAANFYNALDIGVLPVRRGTKETLVPWREWQQERPPSSLFPRWFRDNPDIAALMGSPSNGLVCRDFDDPDAYRRWARAHPDLAGFLPTVQTSRGYHVYCRSDVTDMTVLDLGDGELRHSRCITKLPPSVHETGWTYRFIIRPTKENLIHIDDLVGAGLVYSDLQGPELLTENTERTETTERTEEYRRDSNGVVVVDDVADAIIQETLPIEMHTRHRRLFELARHLQSSPRFSSLKPEDLRPIVEEWHKRALPKIATKLFFETWIDFLKMWPKVRCKIGETQIAKAYGRALTMKPPAIAVEKYPGHKELQLLAALCKELQKAAGNCPFFLSCRTAGDLLNVSHTEANRWLFLLVHDRVIVEVAKGGTHESPRKATRYRYVGSA